MRLGHARGLACAKTKKFPCIFLASPPPAPPPRSGKRNGKEIFGFASPFQSPKRAILFYHFCLLFSPPSRRPRRFLSAFCGGSNPRGFDILVVVTHKVDCARHKQICMCLPRPPCARTNP